MNENFKAAYDNVAAFVQQGIDQLAQFQKTASQQTEEVSQKLRESFKSNSGPVIDLSEKAVSGIIDVQKSVIDAVAQRSVKIAEAAKAKFDNQAGSNPLAPWSEAVQQTVAFQKTLLDFAATQYTSFAEAVRHAA